MTEAKDKTDSEETEGEAEEENGTSRKFGVRTAKTRKDFARDCKRHGRNKIRLVKKQAKEKWTAAALASDTMPRTHHQ